MADFLAEHEPCVAADRINVIIELDEAVAVAPQHLLLMKSPEEVLEQRAVEEVR